MRRSDAALRLVRATQDNNHSCGILKGQFAHKTGIKHLCTDDNHLSGAMQPQTSSLTRAAKLPAGRLFEKKRKKNDRHMVRRGCTARRGRGSDSLRFDVRAETWQRRSKREFVCTFKPSSLRLLPPSPPSFSSPTLPCLLSSQTPPTQTGTHLSTKSPPHQRPTRMRTATGC